MTKLEELKMWVDLYKILNAKIVSSDNTDFVEEKIDKCITDLRRG